MVKLVARLGGLFMALMTALGAGTGAMAECAHAAPDWTPFMLLDKMIRMMGMQPLRHQEGIREPVCLRFMKIRLRR